MAKDREGFLAVRWFSVNDAQVGELGAGRTAKGCRHCEARLIAVSVLRKVFLFLCLAAKIENRNVFKSGCTVLCSSQ